MAFIVLLLLSMTTLVRVESQSAQINLATLQARQNALLGAMIAVGELQEHAGVDQVLTSTSEYIFGVNTLVEAPADAVATGDDTVRQKHWTGIWEAQSPTGNPELEVNRHLMWLVSGNEAVDPDATAFFSDHGSGLGQTKLYARPNTNNGNVGDPPADGHVWMVNDGSVGTTDPTDYVQAPVVDFDEGRGAYAWWVGDEGVKAALTLEDPHRTSDPELSYRVAQKPNFSIFDVWGPGFDANSERLRLNSVEELELAGLSETVSEGLFHDTTPFSLGVLADTRHGGLRKDLARAFAPNTDAALDLIRDDLQAIGRPAATSDYIFEPAGGSETADDPGGPRWEQLRDYYNLRPTSGNSIDLTAGGSSAASILHRDDQLGVYPVVSWAQLRYYLTMTDEVDPIDIANRPDPPVTPVTRRVVFWILPTVQLWNPYDVDLTIPDLYVLISTEVAAQNNLPYKWRVFENKGSNTRVAPQSQNFFQFEEQNDSSDNPLPLVLKLEGTTIPAGSSRLFSPKGNQAIASNQQMFGGADRNVLSSDPSVNGVDYGLYYINNNPKYSQSEFTYDPTANRYFANFPPQGTDLDFNLRLATGTGFNQTDLIQVIDDVKNSIPINTATTIDPLPAQSLSEPLNLDTNPDFPFATYPLAANSFMQVWTNTWLTNTPNDPGILRMPWASLLNPRSSFIGRSGFETDTATSPVANKEKVANPPGLNSHGSKFGHIDPNTPYVGWDVNKIKDSNDLGFIGWDYNDDSSADIQKTTLFEVPRDNASILSVGQFMHANLSRNGNFDSNPDPTNQTWFQPGNRHLYNNYSPAYAIGNSYASPWIPPAQTSLDWSSVSGAGAIDGVHYDYSFLLNEALWDRYFITAIPVSGSIPDPLPNSRLIQNPFDSSLTDADRNDFDRAALAYMTDGAFNVNSTSVEAWKSLLSSFFGLEVTTINGLDSGSGSAFARFNTPLSSSFGGGDPATEQAYSGYRRLTSAEIDDLANAIVDEMKKDPQAAIDAPDGGRRDPYRDLADFVNRDLSGHPKAQLKGLLQRAIDSTTINSVITDDTFGTTTTNSDGVMELADGDIPKTNASIGYTIDAFDGMPYAANVPGYLTQADLLARLGPVLATRSDTFKVRSFGAHTDPLTGETLSQAWAELTVQRMPDYVDNSTPAETQVQSLTADSTNERFGRQFRVLSFRWLPESEI
jgi:hypothetical protein